MDSKEHFVTLFDSNFLPMGMALHHSLLAHAQPFHLWVLCMDELVEQQLTELALAHVSLIPLAHAETEALRVVKQTRNRAEYCWTLSPFAPQFVFDRAPQVKRVTYLDADLFFFDSPQILLQELDDSGKSVLITDHAFAPEYDRSSLAGRFCVQFMTFVNNTDGLRVLHWWQEKCLDWCYDRYEDERFGDQKYLNCWPDIFAAEVHVLQQVEKTLAPWNVKFFAAKNGQISPVFYHFQAFRIIAPNKAMLYTSYQVGPLASRLYDCYVKTVRQSIAIMEQHNFALKCLPLKVESWQWLRNIKRKLLGIVDYATLS